MRLGTTNIATLRLISYGQHSADLQQVSRLFNTTGLTPHCPVLGHSPREWLNVARYEPIDGYRALACADIALRPDLNIIVGNNESGKSTLLEAINLALKCQLNRRPAAYELHPYLFNIGCVHSFVESYQHGTPVPPPEILIELYFTDSDELAELKGTNNSRGEDKPGVRLIIRLDEEHFRDEYAEYVARPEMLRTVPVEYYEIIWQSFANATLDNRWMPVHSSLIDPSAVANTYIANKYIREVTREYLSHTQQVELALSYRKLRDVFLEDQGVIAINEELAKKKGVVSDKTLSVAMDMTTRAGWESAVLPHLDGVPMTLVGRGEQNSVKIKLALEAERECNVVLIEEPENHLSHSNLNRLLSHLSERAAGKQLIITTHSSFVLNKLGIENVLMFSGERAISIEQLSPDTQKYFKKLPGYDTLRMILARRTILVEGPSDELVVQKAFVQKHGKVPLQFGVEVISVNALAFKRFLEIAKLLKLSVCVVTDNDRRPEAVSARYQEYANEENIRICFSPDKDLFTLEKHLLALNCRSKLNRVFHTSFASDADLLDHMLSHKAECALALFESPETFVTPKYIEDAIQ